MDAEIYLVRHGETEWNAQGRIQGCLDSPLTPNGREQARQIGMLLARVLRDCLKSLVCCRNITR
jgi:broad specificity phosphatase PhoE